MFSAFGHLASFFPSQGKQVRGRTYFVYGSTSFLTIPKLSHFCGLQLEMLSTLLEGLFI